MMYAVVSSGGKQYRIREGEIFKVEKIAGNPGTPVSFDNILMFSDGENVRIGQPSLDDVTVRGHIVEQGKAKKIIVFKYKRRKRYRRKQGHRQKYTAIMIDAIEAPGVKRTVEEPVVEAAPVKQEVEAAPVAAEETPQTEQGTAAEAKVEEKPDTDTES